MKKIILLLLIITTASAVFALDWGGNIENYTLVENDIDELTQKNKLALWLELNPTELITIGGQVSAAYSYGDYDYLFDLDHLYAEIIVPKNSLAVTIKFGRFFQSEFSGNVFAHKMDGLFISLGVPLGNFSLGVGYTGLLLKHEAKFNQTSADFVDDNDNSLKFAPKKLIGNLSASFIDIFPSHQLDIAILGQYDLRTGTKLKDGDLITKDGDTRFNSLYAGIGFSGVVTSAFVYNLFFYYQFGNALTEGDTTYKSNFHSALMAGANLNYIINKFLFSKFSLSALYASGDNDIGTITAGVNKDGNNTQFIPITTSSTGLLFDPNVSNLIKTSFEYSLKPFSGLSNKVMKEFLTSVKGTAYFKTTASDISETTIWLAEDEKYLGTEIILNIGFRPLSDVGISLAGAVFIPNSSSNDDIQYGGMLFASLSF